MFPSRMPKGIVHGTTLPGLPSEALSSNEQLAPVYVTPLQEECKLSSVSQALETPTVVMNPMPECPG